MDEIKATKAEIAKLKSDMAVRGLRKFVNVFEGYIYSEFTDRMRDAIDLLVARYGEPKEPKEV